MKNLFIILFLLYLNQNVKCQIVSSTSNKFIPCCNYSDSLDFNNDLIFEFEILSDYFGMVIGFVAESKPDVLLSDTITTTGNNFNFQDNLHSYSLAATTFSSNWSYWEPNTGLRYLGLAKVNSPNDTTFGWVELDFRGETFTTLDPPNDTIFIIRYAYNTIPNEHIFAGQLSTNMIYEQLSDFIRVFPNPSNEILFIHTENALSEYEVILTDISGKIIFRKENLKQIDVSEFASGFYFITIPELNHTEKIQVIK